MRKFPGRDLRVFVIWEKVLASDWARPGDGVLGRVGDSRAAQFWDPERELSKSLGETKTGQPVWDRIGVYPGGAWSKVRATPTFSGRPVVKVAGQLTEKIEQAHGLILVNTP